MTRIELEELEGLCESYGIPKKKLVRGVQRLIEFLQKPGPVQKVREGVAVTLSKVSLRKCFGRVGGRGTKELYPKAKALLLKVGCIELVNKHCQYRAAAAEYMVQGWLRESVLLGADDSAEARCDRTSAICSAVVPTVRTPTRDLCSEESSLFIHPLRSKSEDLDPRSLVGGRTEPKQELNSLLFKANKTDSDMSRIRELSHTFKKARRPTAASPSPPPGPTQLIHDRREQEFRDRMEQALELERGAA